MPMPIAAASFSSVTLRRRFPPASICERAAWEIPILSATSACVSLRYSRQARARVYPFLTVRPTPSWGMASPCGTRRGAFGNRRTYSSNGMTTNAGFPSCMMVWMSVGSFVTFLDLLDHDDPDVILDIEQDTPVADAHPETVFAADQGIHVPAARPSPRSVSAASYSSRR